MSDIVYCKDCAYAEPNNLDAYHAVKFGVFCTRYKQNTIGIHGCDNGKPKPKTNADRTDDLLKFAKWVAESVCVSDDKWGGDCWAFQEIACRMLVKLGIMEENDGFYSLKQEGET